MELEIGDLIAAGVFALLLVAFSTSLRAGVRQVRTLGFGLLGVCAGWALGAAVDLYFYSATWPLSIPGLYLFTMGLGIIGSLLIASHTKPVHDDLFKSKSDWKATVIFAFSILIFLVAGTPLAFHLFSWTPIESSVITFEFYMIPLILLAALLLFWNSRRKRD